ncbi:amidohydrolase family protein [Erythrobacter sp. SDW2]|uniref:amidohydrolase family protein n=1 Tax=Erythrobacter sp. SDW2 TaxID=2907154 RepID=UPI001F26CF36|nr:amidohydrolase family protein [Erythrobacter sp. SDW2]UIP07221.1 amidohydrolase family protein [Erythrobacter sp. SDW2]
MNRLIARTVFGAVSALAIIAAAPAAAQDFVIVDATLVTGDGSEPVENGVVIVDDGKVTYAGPQSGAGSFETDAVIDVEGKWVTPGIFMPVTDLGLYDVSGVGETNDTSAGRSRFNAALDASTAVNYASQHVAVSRRAGITRASIVTTPSNAIFGGQGAVIDTGEDSDPVVKARAFQMVTLGERGGEIAGGSRIAAYVELANAMREAADFAAGKWSGDGNLLTRADAEALVPVVNGSQPLYVRVERAADIQAVLGLRNTYPRLQLVLLGVGEGWMVARDIAAAGVPVIADPLEDLPDSFEQLGVTQSNVGRMAAAGVKVALGGLAGGTNEQPGNARQFAGNIVGLSKVPGAAGLSWGKAFAAISSIPAEIAGFGGTLGVLKPGAAADVVIWDGDPLEVSSGVVTVYIDGVEQSLESHQTRLRDRYKDLDESDLPKAYDW